jgi:hypothetical protein
LFSGSPRPLAEARWEAVPCMNQWELGTCAAALLLLAALGAACDGCFRGRFGPAGADRAQLRRERSSCQCRPGTVVLQSLRLAKYQDRRWRSDAGHLLPP